MAISTRNIVPLLSFGVDQTLAVNDTLGVSDALTLAWVQDRPTDTLTLSDSFSRLNTSARSVADSVVLADARAISQGKKLADSVVLSDSATPSKGISQALSDSVVLADARTMARGKAVADAIVMADATVDAQGVSIGNSLVVADSLSRVVAAARSVLDTLALSDSLTSAKTIPKAVNDTVTLSDSVLTSKAKTVSPADTVTLSDSLSSQVAHGQNPADSVVLADARTHARGLARTDSVVVADNFSSSALIGLTAAPADSVRITDAVVLDWVADRGFNDDTVGLSDAHVEFKVGGANPQDAVALTDSVSHVATFARTLADVIAGLPYGTGEYGEGSYGTGTGLVDTQTFGVGKKLSDSVGLSDGQALDLVGGGEVAVDDIVLVLTDQFTRVVVALRSATDSVAVSDSILVEKGHIVSVSDAVVLADARTKVYAKSQTDTVGIISDAIVTGIPRFLGLADTVVLSDFVDLNQFLTQLLDAIYTGHIGYGDQGDNGNGDRPEISDTVGGVIEEEVMV